MSTPPALETAQCGTSGCWQGNLNNASAKATSTMQVPRHTSHMAGAFLKCPGPADFAECLQVMIASSIAEQRQSMQQLQFLGHHHSTPEHVSVQWVCTKHSWHINLGLHHNVAAQHSTAQHNPPQPVATLFWQISPGYKGKVDHRSQKIAPHVKRLQINNQLMLCHLQPLNVSHLGQIYRQVLEGYLDTGQLQGVRKLMLCHVWPCISTI